MDETVTIGGQTFSVLRLPPSEVLRLRSSFPADEWKQMTQSAQFALTAASPLKIDGYRLIAYYGLVLIYEKVNDDEQRAADRAELLRRLG